MENDIAVLLNARARRVTPRVVHSIERLVPQESIYLSRSLEEAASHTREIMSRGYSKVLTGGGDGTLVSFINHSLSYASSDRDLPLIGVLKLGTGNGIGKYVGAGAYLQDLRLIAQGVVTSNQPVSLVEVEGVYCYFAGFGLDAAILNDLSLVKKSRLGERLGYALSVPFISLPRQLTVRRRYPTARVVNRGRAAYRIGPDGRPTGRPIERGEVIYEGPVQILSAGTIPYYGYGFKIFPHVERRPGKMQLRISRASTWETLRNLKAVWRGLYRSETIEDYWVESVQVEFERDVPFQIGGDGVGLRREVTFTLSNRTVQLIDLSAARLPSREI